MTNKRPTDHLEPDAKKRGADRQITKDDDASEDEQVVAGTFQRADEETIKQRKIVRARRAAGGTTGSSEGVNPFAGVQLAAPPAANPFASVSLVPAAAAPAATPTAAAEAPAAEAGKAPEVPAADKPAAEAAQQPGDKSPAKEAGGEEAAKEAAAPAPVFGGLGGFNAGGGGFGSLASGAATGGFGSLGGAATSGAFAFGAAPTSGAAPAAGAQGGSLFGSAPAPGTSIFGSTPAPKAGLPAEQPVTTGEEGEEAVFAGETALFEFDAARQWRERGRGELRVNVAPSGRGRLVMRQKGNLRLLLNANLWPEMQVTKMEGGKGATFACINAAALAEEGRKPEGAAGAAAKEGGAGSAAAPAVPALATFAARFKTADDLGRFVEAVDGAKTHKAT